MERPTFSPNWSRVNQLTPTLRPQVQVARRIFRGQPWYVLHDPLGNTFSRLNPVAYYMIGLLDGERTVEDAWRLTLEQHGDAAPTQNEVIGLLGQLNQSNLLRGNVSPDAEPLLQRHRRMKLKRWSGQAMSVLFMQIPLFNPDRILLWLGPLVRPLLSRVGLALWVVWMIVCGAFFFPHIGRFFKQSEDLLQTPANWGWVILLFIAVKLLHELGHGLVCRRFGGPVYEAGIMMLVLFPNPYMDTTSSWSFDNRFKRMLVGMAGMMFELTIAGAAALVWVHSEDPLLQQVSHRLIFLASVATVLFNANPLMRFDGYFILSDLLDMPNLYERSTQQMKWLCQRYLFGIKSAQPPSTRQSERTIFLIYGISALIYRVLIMLAISTFIASFAFTLGLALAAWTIFTWLAIPTGKYIRWLVAGGDLHGKRQRAFGVTGGIVAACVLVFGLMPWEEHRRTLGVVEAAERAVVTVQTTGFVTEVFVEPGDHVEAGQLIIILENPALQSRKQELLANIDATETELRHALTQDPVQRITSRAKIEAFREELAQVEQSLADLVIRSPMSGRFVALDPLAPTIGSYHTAGTLIGQVIDPDSLRITALVDQNANSLVLRNDIDRIELRTRGRAHHNYDSHLIQAFDSGRSTLPHPSLSTLAGGTVSLHPDDRNQSTTLKPQFYLWLAMPDEPSVAHDAAFQPGQRVHVRFTLAERRPLVMQWLHRLNQLIDPKQAL